MKARTVLAAILALALVAALMSGCTTRVITSDGAQPLNTVTASGEGKTAAAPDMAQMYFGVSAHTETAKEALDSVSKTAEAITKAVKDAGVKAEDIQTANVSVYPDLNYTGTKPVVVGYQASIQVRVKIRDIEKVGDVIGAASDAGANEIGGPSFMLSDESDARNEALALAIADAKDRAGAIAKASGKTLGEIIAVSESSVNVPIYYAGDIAASAEAMKVPIETGQLDITANVTVVFELK